MIATSVSTRQITGPSASEPSVPLVFLVHDDSRRESLELLIRSAGWQPAAFVSVDEFLAVRGRRSRRAFCSISMGSICRSVSRHIEAIRP
jgi:hypothetical protein